MSTNADTDTFSEPPRKKRGRPPGSRKDGGGRVAKGRKEQKEQEGRQINDGQMELLQRNGERAGIALSDTEVEASLEYSSEERHLTPFSRMLRNLIHRDRSELIRVARELEISENTVYRWMNGSSEPRATYLRRLLDVFPQQRDTLLHAITQTFGDMPDISIQGLHEVRKEVYHEVLSRLAQVGDREAPLWDLVQTIFRHILEHLDSEQRGLAIAYAQLMPPHEDGIHSMLEMMIAGTGPWATMTRSGVYLGCTTLAGAAVEFQRVQIWDQADVHQRAQVEIDLFERSACAVPIMRGSHIAGALIVSSTQPGFFYGPMACQIVEEYALLVGVALPDHLFYPCSKICLRPMPELSWQRLRVGALYQQSILKYASTHGLSRREAGSLVQRELEALFEQQVQSPSEPTLDGTSAYDK